MKKINFQFHRLLYPLVILFLAIVIFLSFFLLIKYYHQSSEASEKIKLYIQEVALEKVDREKAEQVINNLNREKTAELNLSGLVNPFKVFEKVEELVD